MKKFQKNGFKIIAILIRFWPTSLPEMKILKDFGLFVNLFVLSHMNKTKFRGILMLVRRSCLKFISRSLSNIRV